MPHGLLVLDSNTLFALVHQSNSIAASKRGLFNQRVVSICADGDERLYYVDAASPQTVWQRPLQSTTAVKLHEEAAPIIKVLFHRNKLYWIAGSTLVCFDLLCKVPDIVRLPSPVVNFEAAGHGFVLALKDGAGERLVLYHFNDGVKPFPLPPCALLGSLKHGAVLSDRATGQYVTLDATGTSGQLSAQLPAGASAIIPFDETVMALSAARDRVVFGSKESMSFADDRCALATTVPPKPEDDPVCTLCFCEFEDDGCLTFDCGHQFHLDCVAQWAAKWDEFAAKGNHIVFTNAVCPGGCRALMRHPRLEQSRAIEHLYDKVRAVKQEALRVQWPAKTDEDLLCYQCFKCHEPFFGGEKVCFRMQSGEPTKRPEDLLCNSCMSDFTCPAGHSPSGAGVLRKCRYCCNVATNRCFGNRYLCDRCEQRWTGQTEPEAFPCPGAAECPLGGNHPDGTFPIGCAICDLDKVNVEKLSPPSPAA